MPTGVIRWFGIIVAAGTVDSVSVRYTGNVHYTVLFLLFQLNKDKRFYAVTDLASLGFVSIGAGLCPQDLSDRVTCRETDVPASGSHRGEASN